MVKCEDCGFLAIRHKETLAFAEYPKEARLTGCMPEIQNIAERYRASPNQSYYPYDERPICFVQAFDLEALYRKRQTARGLEPGFSPNDQDVRQVIKEEIPCKEWRKWVLGFTPKEHREMMDRERMLQWQADEAKLARRFRLLELGIITLGVLAAIAGIALGSFFTVRAANIEAEGARQAADMQIEAMKRQSQPTNVINVPPAQIIIQPSTPDKGGSQP